MCYNMIKKLASQKKKTIFWRKVNEERKKVLNEYGKRELVSLICQDGFVVSDTAWRYVKRTCSECLVKH